LPLTILDDVHRRRVRIPAMTAVAVTCALSIVSCATSEPGEPSRREATLAERLNIAEFRPSGDRADAGVWLASVGDWGYGIDVPGVRIQGNWIQLFGSPLPSESWVDGGALMAHAGSIEGELVSLPAMLATFPDGTTHPIVPGL
jgi:hypothetical protein